MSIGIVQGDQIIHVAGFGQADSHGRPLTPQTPMITASITKSFTALAVMQLVEAGKVDLDAPVQRYLSWFRVAEAVASARITVRHLLNQTSGLPTFQANAGTIGGPTDDQALERLVRSIAGVSLSQPVGSTYQYSNFNYQILGMLIQTVSGESYEQYLRRHVLDALDMRHSFTSQAAAQSHGLSSGYRFWFGVPVATDLTYSRTIRPAGGLVSTSEDLAQYLIAQLNGGRYGAASVLSPAGIAELHRGAARIGDMDNYYGMGWQTGAIGDIPIVQHDGVLITGYAHMILLPEHNLGIVVLANGVSRVAEQRLGGIAPGIASMLLGKPAPPATENRIFQALTIASFGIIAVQLFGIFRTARKLRLWQRQVESRPTGALSLAWHLGVPLAVNLVWAAAVLVGVPALFSLPLVDSVFALGDFAYVIAGSAAVALVWGPLRTVLAWRALHTTASAEGTAARNPSRLCRSVTGKARRGACT
jgi:CubicO group peptidase (beta-lactamase class C family)